LHPGGWVNEEADIGRALREVMGRYPTGVAIVAGIDGEGRPYGMTVNSLTSLSLRTPLVLLCIDHRAAFHATLTGSEHFLVNVLAADQSGLADRFASEPSRGRFEGVPWQPEGPGALPRIERVSAWMACARHEVLEGGDHSILVGRVESLGSREGRSLLFHRGMYGSTGA